ncbi:UDP-N-acetylmuramoyl-tripeptide--D-alanyl-D-alanine ligase [Spongiimicrobium sp. 3-5]|uniref:UDP-N-acetylmuramoyl-tripeptide--D-alanyl-D- alanine ligase n=1 Tax=Spongiimicrobium sp. 3-5 TaxID=3332596 RepID=UPI0039816041
MSIEELHQFFLQHPNVCTDTRKLKKDDIFFALKGDNFNGNLYASEALAKGASLAIIDEKEQHFSNKTLLVDNALETLQQLANFHRNYYKARVIALTGSNGKTTTKELIHAVLSKKYSTIATQGNLNNHIGVPLTLLSITQDTEIAIVEMGANHQKEISFLCKIAQPDFGYITNFGKAHLEGFGGEAGVIKGKSELYDYLMDNDKSVFLNADDEIQEKKLRSYIKKMGFSGHNHTYYNILFLGADPYVALKAEDVIIKSQLIGSYNFTNCAIAVLMGKYFNVPIADTKSAIESFVPQNNRSQVIIQNGHKIVLDAYNANPTSMEAALQNFKNMTGTPKIVFLGDMFELGETAAKEHQYIADMAAKLGFDKIFLVGVNFDGVTSSLQTFSSFDTLKLYLKEHKPEKSTILIKGSRGMALERILPLL